MLSLLSASPLAFAGGLVVAPSTRAAVSMDLTKEELGVALNPAIGYWDPLGLAKADFWGAGNEATWGFLRHSEIKHGRVAMFAFVGYCVQANGIHWGWPLSLPVETNAQYETLSPPEQWDALTDIGKLQIILFVGFLEFWGELGGQHYMRGGKPGAYPEFPAKNVIPATPVPVLNLYQPFGGKSMTPEKKARGLLAEINNGRMAMLGIFAFITEQKIPGSVPWGPHLPVYTGDVMAPFLH